MGSFKFDSSGNGLPSTGSSESSVESWVAGVFAAFFKSSVSTSSQVCSLLLFQPLLFEDHVSVLDAATSGTESTCSEPNSLLSVFGFSTDESPLPVTLPHCKAGFSSRGVPHLLSLVVDAGASSGEVEVVTGSEGGAFVCLGFLLVLFFFSGSCLIFGFPLAQAPLTALTIGLECGVSVDFLECLLFLLLDLLS